MSFCYTTLNVILLHYIECHFATLHMILFHCILSFYVKFPVILFNAIVFFNLYIICHVTFDFVTLHFLSTLIVGGEWSESAAVYHSNAHWSRDQSIWTRLHCKSYATTTSPLLELYFCNLFEL